MIAYGLDTNLQVNTPANLPTVNRPKLPPPLMGGNMDRTQQTTVMFSTIEENSNGNKNQGNNNEKHVNYHHERIIPSAY